MPDQDDNAEYGSVMEKVLLDSITKSRRLKQEVLSKTAQELNLSKEEFEKVKPELEWWYKLYMHMVYEGVTGAS